MMQTLTSKAKAPEETAAERRKTKRHRLGIRVSWRVLGERDSRYSAAELKDVGTDGLALVVRRPCKCGTVVVVQLQGAPEAEPMLLRAEWAKEEPGNKWLVGCSFTSALTEKELQAFLVAARRSAEEPAATESPQKASADPFVVGSARERRGAPRRGGLDVPVLVCRAEGGPRVEGVVVDRSLTGLGIMIRMPFSRGTQLTIRPSRANEKTAAVGVQVRSCRQKGKQWLLGCQFLSSPSANQLLLFG